MYSPEENTLPPNYTGGLAQAAARKQIELIRKSKREYAETGKVEDRPKVSSQPTPRSSHVIRFEKKYGFPVTETARVKKLFPDSNIDKILAKGIAAYGSSGSRPNVSKAQWANARLASVLTGGPALKVDKDLVGQRSLEKIR